MLSSSPEYLSVIDLDARYRRVSELGRGGMGAVYLAVQRGLDREVALKLLEGGDGEDTELVRRFYREARLTSRISNPHVVQVLDFGRFSEGHFIAYGLIQGRTLREILAGQSTLHPERVRRIALEVLDGLAALHAAGVLHRDVSPSNIMIRDPDEIATLIDLGLATSPGMTAITQARAVMGTPHYMTPDVIRGDDRIDGRGDLYSLGAVMFHLLAGQPPFDGPTVLEILRAHLEDPPPRLRDLAPGCPEDLEREVLRALSKYPEDRCENAEAMARALAAGIPPGSPGSGKYGSPPATGMSSSRPRAGEHVTLPVAATGVRTSGIGRKGAGLVALLSLPVGFLAAMAWMRSFSHPVSAPHGSPSSSTSVPVSPAPSSASLHPVLDRELAAHRARLVDFHPGVRLWPRGAPELLEKLRVRSNAPELRGGWAGYWLDPYLDRSFPLTLRFEGDPRPTAISVGGWKVDVPHDVTEITIPPSARRSGINWLAVEGRGATPPRIQLVADGELALRPGSASRSDGSVRPLPPRAQEILDRQFDKARHREDLATVRDLVREDPGDVRLRRMAALLTVHHLHWSWDPVGRMLGGAALESEVDIVGSCVDHVEVILQRVPADGLAWCLLGGVLRIAGEERNADLATSWGIVLDPGSFWTWQQSLSMHGHFARRSGRELPPAVKRRHGEVLEALRLHPDAKHPSIARRIDETLDRLRSLDPAGALAPRPPGADARKR